ncbi:hypothetical protein GH714_001901 [Hevea brasiliensis]|uniref:Uncharacterized protein n=1 Tax=Hevea brasiliensis TaxID=3981 RepID=A0A6A6LUH3_HEVBR|nr:hypothetical protein GH714_001901 [Hevea brasiliensis]
MRKRAIQGNLAQLHVKKSKGPDRDIFEVKPLDFLVHLASSLYKPQSIIAGRTPVQIAKILKILEEQTKAKFNLSYPANEGARGVVITDTQDASRIETSTRDEIGKTRVSENVVDIVSSSAEAEVAGLKPPVEP